MGCYAESVFKKSVLPSSSMSLMQWPIPCMIIHDQGDEVRLANDWHTPTVVPATDEAEGEPAQTPEDGDLGQ